LAWLTGALINILLAQISLETTNACTGEISRQDTSRHARFNTLGAVEARIFRALIRVNFAANRCVRGIFKAIAAVAIKTGGKIYTSCLASRARIYSTAVEVKFTVDTTKARAASALIVPNLIHTFTVYTTRAASAIVNVGACLPGIVGGVAKEAVAYRRCISGTTARRKF